jgi:mono/diheme cytochrome c family protein
LTDIRPPVIPGLLLLAVIVPLLGGCARESPSEKPPIHVVPDMDHQPKYKAQAESDFFADASAMRLPVKGTVPRGYLRADDAFYRGRDETEAYVTANPLPPTAEVLHRGEERFNIYCSPCHGKGGRGDGTVVARGFTQPPDFVSDSLRQMPVGQMFEAVTNGVRNMPSYRHQLRPEDRWAIIAYLRQLQGMTEPGDTLE